MKKRSSGKGKSKQQKLTLLDLEHVLFQVDGAIFDVESAPDEVFDAFIKQYIDVGWSLEDRRDALNHALEQGKAVPIIRRGESVEVPRLDGEVRDVEVEEILCSKDH